MRDKIGFLVGMFKSGGEGTLWFLMTAYRTTGKGERGKGGKGCRLFGLFIV